MNPELFEALAVDRTVSFTILSIILVVAAFNIVSSLISLVRAKTRDIAVLRTMGATRGEADAHLRDRGHHDRCARVAAGGVLGFLFITFREAVVKFIGAGDRPEYLGSCRCASSPSCRPRPIRSRP